MHKPSRRSTTARIACSLAIAGLLALLTGRVSGTAAAAGKPIEIVAFGDSLTAGFGLQASESFPARLEQALKAKGHNVTVTNAGVSGDTTGAGLARFDWAIGPKTQAVILELGANDALRGLPPDQAERNLDAIIAKLKARGIPVLVTGMRAPNNWGEGYRRRFDSIFAKLAKKHSELLYPFFLEGVALKPELNQPDGIHPNAKGVNEIVLRILPSVEKLLARAKSGS